MRATVHRQRIEKLDRLEAREVGLLGERAYRFQPVHHDVRDERLPGC
jgi:hypothetical protein